MAPSESGGVSKASTFKVAPVKFWPIWMLSAAFVSSSRKRNKSRRIEAAEQILGIFIVKRIKCAPLFAEKTGESQDKTDKTESLATARTKSVFRAARRI